MIHLNREVKWIYREEGSSTVQSQSIYAAVFPVSSRQYDALHAQDVWTTVRFTVRFSDYLWNNLKYYQQIEYRGHRYRILDMIEDGDNREFITIVGDVVWRQMGSVV